MQSISVYVRASIRACVRVCVCVFLSSQPPFLSHVPPLSNCMRSSSTFYHSFVRAITHSLHLIANIHPRMQRTPFNESYTSLVPRAFLPACSAVDDAFDWFTVFPKLFLTLSAAAASLFLTECSLTP